VGALGIVALYASAVALPVAAIVWAVNIGSSVHHIEETLVRMDERQAAASQAGPGVPAGSAPSVDVEPFVD
jgi:hypothetical protein